MGLDRRTDVRLPISLPVRARFGRMLRHLTTLDISKNGLFVVMDTPPARGQLIHVSVLLPGGGPPLPMRGMALHVVTGDEARERRVPAGAGMQFYGIGLAARQRWDQFFDEALAAHSAGGGIAHPPTPRSASPTKADGDTLRADEMQRVSAALSDRVRGDDVSDDAPAEKGHSVPPTGSEETKPGALAATGAVQPPRGWAEPAHFRLCPPDGAAVMRFREDALDSGGIVLVGAGGHAAGTPAVVSVVHPETGAEFHVPGEVQPGGEERNAAVVKFFAVTDRTKEEFEIFADQGAIPAVRTSRPTAAEPELSIYWSAEEAQWDLVTDPGATVVVEGTLPLEAAVNPFVRGR